MSLENKRDGEIVPTGFDVLKSAQSGFDKEILVVDAIPDDIVVDGVEKGRVLNGVIEEAVRRVGEDRWKGVQLLLEGDGIENLVLGLRGEEFLSDFDGYGLNILSVVVGVCEVVGSIGVLDGKKRVGSLVCLGEAIAEVILRVGDGNLPGNIVACAGVFGAIGQTILSRKDEIREGGNAWVEGVVKVVECLEYRFSEFESGREALVVWKRVGGAMVEYDVKGSMEFIGWMDGEEAATMIVRRFQMGKGESGKRLLDVFLGMGAWNAAVLLDAAYRDGRVLEIEVEEGRTLESMALHSLLEHLKGGKPPPIKYSSKNAVLVILRTVLRAPREERPLRYLRQVVAVVQDAEAVQEAFECVDEALHRLEESSVIFSGEDAKFESEERLFATLGPVLAVRVLASSEAGKRALAQNHSQRRSIATSLGKRGMASSLSSSDGAREAKRVALETMVVVAPWVAGGVVGRVVSCEVWKEEEEEEQKDWMCGMDMVQFVRDSSKTTPIAAFLTICLASASPIPIIHHLTKPILDAFQDDQHSQALLSAASSLLSHPSHPPDRSVDLILRLPSSSAKLTLLTATLPSMRHHLSDSLLSKILSSLHLPSHPSAPHLQLVATLISLHPSDRLLEVAQQAAIQSINVLTSPDLSLAELARAKDMYKAPGPARSVPIAALQLLNALLQNKPILLQLSLPTPLLEQALRNFNP